MSGKSGKKTVVIVGGGQAGAAIARPLSKALSPETHRIIVINPRPYRIILPATLRLVASDQNDLENPEKGALVPYDKLFLQDNGEVIHASVTEVIQKPGEKTGFVKLNTGEEIEYHALVLASGSQWGGPINFPEGDKTMLLDYIADRREEIARAKDILIVGGGSVGIELAGEIKDIFPTKPVTIIQRDTKLLNTTYPERFRNRMQAQIVSRGVKLVLGDSLDIEGEIPSSAPAEGFKTKSGERLKADLVFRATGPVPNTSYLATSSLSSVLTPKGTVKVQPTLQLPGYSNIFAAGDIVEWDEQKSAAKAGLGHAPIVLKNLQEYLNGGNKMKEYKGSMEMIIVTNGKSSGLGYLDMLWGIVLGQWFSVMIKSKTLMVSMGRGLSGN
ncbi:FAD/NAD-P-binding domain-containing protein [Dendrothele bispora CBS 962.96]|uniref:FAD/NAD-P-binding domain-containing protein n=1 Tax=Dendrothele bispora (strain CBS 962.96) TaxID=1314807 RepID=A0A4S8MIF8_DENBC|nr:FAD/NAD-P-binding domain-containing protein [Dendrothele bispora CBS 962.96]